MKAFNITGGDTITVTYTAGTGFVGSSGTITQTVTALHITVTAAASGKTYDGSTSSSVAPTITSGSLVSGDTAAFSETYYTKNAGTALSLTPSGSVNDGNSGLDYAVTFVTSTTGSIAARAITVTAASGTKGYDGTTSFDGCRHGHRQHPGYRRHGGLQRDF